MPFMGLEWDKEIWRHNTMGGFVLMRTICFVARDRVQCEGIPPFPIWECNGMELVNNRSLCQEGKEPTGIISLLTFRHEVMID